MLRLAQLIHSSGERRVSLVDEPWLYPLTSCRSVFELATEAIQQDRGIAEIFRSESFGVPISYDAVYHGQSEWKLLAPIDHPDGPARCLVTGTGLTHKASAENRSSMHVSSRMGSPHPAEAVQPLNDSMKMYRIGLEGGRPDAGKIGEAPEWFYKGSGTVLKAHNEALTVPNFAEDGGDEAEIAGIYVIGPDETPFRVGFVQGNEFSDHVTESKNYLYLAPSKLRQCAIGPELIVGGDFGDVPGQIAIQRGGEVVWQAKIASGEANMCHSLANLEHHHFKYDQHRRRGDMHIHFFGADHFSFRDRVRLQDGDVMSVSFDGFGRSLHNPIRIDRSPQALVTARAL
jgi:hypothetical protein